MILTPVMATAGLVAALCQFAAHHLMRDSKASCVRRYIVGSAIVCACFAIGWWVDPTQHPTAALLYLYAASYIGTRAGYATNPKPKPSLEEQVAYLDKRAAAVVGEHTDDGKAHRD